MSLDEHFLDYAGRYRLRRKVAEGGMATVYEAELLGPFGFAKRVALKVIHPEYAKKGEWLQLFIDEAKLSANLIHGNIVQIYQLGELNGDYYIAMEYIEGPTLRAVIDRHRELSEPMPPALAAYVASRVCRALDFAHNFLDANGDRVDIVHRDVSPGNIMATWDGHIKLADFGIAKANTSHDPAAERAMLMGKKYYMSPEQILGLPVDAASDVFSMGVVLFELLALERLFTEDVTQLAIDEVAVLPIRNIRAHIPELDARLEDIILRALDKDPARRPSAALMGRTLDDWCLSQQLIGTPDRLQDHLARLFPTTFRRPSVSLEQPTEFKNLRHAVRSESSPTNSGLLARLFKREKY